MSGNRRNVVYTDGACAGNGKSGATAGWGTYWGEGHRDNQLGPVHGAQTNNRAELQAAVEATETAHARGMDNLTIKTDSRLMCDSMNKWVGNWKDNGWKTSSGGDVKNRDLIERLDSYRGQMDVRFEHVAGHAGVRGNEAADRMARHAANEAATSRSNSYNNDRGYERSGYNGGSGYNRGGYNGGSGHNGGYERSDNNGGGYNGGYNNARGYGRSGYNGGSGYNRGGYNGGSGHNGGYEGSGNNGGGYKGGSGYNGGSRYY